jgi:hypothetical protein
VIACLFVAEQELQVEMTSQIISTLAPMEKEHCLQRNTLQFAYGSQEHHGTRAHFVESPCLMLV